MTISNNISNYLQQEISTHPSDTKTFDNSFESGLMISQKEDVNADKEMTQGLIADIMSVLRTGHTVAELEEIEELLQEIQKRLQEESTNKSATADDIKKMVQQLELAILKLQKDNDGVVIKEAPTDATSKSTDSVSPELSALSERVKEATQVINELSKNATLKPDISSSSHYKMELLIKLKENSA